LVLWGRYLKVTQIGRDRPVYHDNLVPPASRGAGYPPIHLVAHQGRAWPLIDWKTTAAGHYWKVSNGLAAAVEQLSTERARRGLAQAGLPE
jgi:hypothetical protein